MRKKYIKPAAFVERIDMSDVISTSSCVNLVENEINSTSTTCVYDAGGLTIFSNNGCEWQYNSFQSNDKLCYNIPFYASTLFGS